jgi:uncharacterized membrane protein
MSFLKKHPPLPVSDEKHAAEVEALNEAIAESERVIAKRRHYEAIGRGREEWRGRLPELEAEALAIIAERGGDPDDEDDVDADPDTA